MDVYANCPILSDGRFLLRQVADSDWADLLQVYSDLKAVPIFNSDNCTGDFYITTKEDMDRTIAFWLMEYGQRYYVRWAIVDRTTDRAVGTIELFNRTAADFFNNMGLLRLDLRSDYETEETVRCLLVLLLPRVREMFGCGIVATKIPPCAEVRRETLCAMGFAPTSEKVIGHDGRAYGDYYICTV